MQNKLHECSLSQFFDSLLFNTLRARPLNQEQLGFLFVSTLAATMVKSYSFNPLWTMNTTIFQETSNLYHTLKPIIGRLFQTIIFGRSLWSSFIDSFSFAKKRCNTWKVLAPFSTGLPSSVCVVDCAFVMAVLVYQISKTKTEI